MECDRKKFLYKSIWGSRKEIKMAETIVKKLHKNIFNCKEKLENNSGMAYLVVLFSFERANIYF